MKKKAASWIPSGLFTIITALATFYCLLEYRESVLIIGIASLLLLASAFWLFTCLNRIARERAEAAKDIGKEQRERMNYEGMKLQGEELIRLVNSLGKGIYVYNKRTSECMQSLFDQVLKTQQLNEQLVNLLIQNQTKTAKFQVKYNQEETNRLIMAMKENNDKLNHELSGKLTEITTCVQTLQTQFDTFPAGAVLSSIPAETEPVPPSADSEETALPEIETEPAPVDSSASSEPAVPETEPEPVDSSASAETAEPTIPPISDDPNKQLSPEEIAALFAALG